MKSKLRGRVGVGQKADNKTDSCLSVTVTVERAGSKKPKFLRTSYKYRLKVIRQKLVDACETG